MGASIAAVLVGGTAAVALWLLHRAGTMPPDGLVTLCVAATTLSLLGGLVTWTLALTTVIWPYFLPPGARLVEAITCRTVAERIDRLPSLRLLRFVTLVAAPWAVVVPRLLG